MGVVDPDATLLSNGSVRLVYLSYTSSSRAICTAESRDGLQFQLVAMALTLTGTTDTVGTDLFLFKTAS